MKSARDVIAILGCGDHIWRHVWNVPSHELLQTNYCTRNSRNNAIVVRPLRTIASHDYCTNYCDRKQLLQRQPLRNQPPLRTPKLSENQTCTDLRATISRHVVPPISWWGKTVDSFWRSCRNSRLIEKEGGFPAQEKGQFPGGRKRHKMVTTILVDV